MKNKKIISKENKGPSLKQRLFRCNWLVYLGIVLCLTAFHVLSAETPDTENKETEVVQEGEQTPENTEEDNSLAISDQPGDETDSEQVEVKKEVITGTSDRMERYEKEGITILIGNAKTKRHTEDGVEIGFLNADTITLKTDPETGETIEIIAEKNVEIRDDKIFATCDHATMNNLTSLITLKENVVVLQKNDRLETKLFTYNRVTGKQTGVGEVKFKVTVTQAAPTASEESEETDADETDTTNGADSSGDKVDPSGTEEKDEKKSETDSDKEDSEEKAKPKETNKEKDESESIEESEAEETESDENEQPETEEVEETESDDTNEETQE